MIPLHQLLISEFDVQESDIEKAQAYQRKQGGRIEQILINMGAFAEDNLIKLYQIAFNLPIISLDIIDNIQVTDLESGLLEAAAEHGWIPVAIDKDTWEIATTFPLNLNLQQFISNNAIEANLQLATESDIQAILSKLTEQGNVQLAVSLSGDEEARLKELATEAPVVNKLNSLIGRALREGSSDMHLEPFAGNYRVRYRVDGVLHEVEQLPGNMQLPLVTRVKILSGMDIAEKRRPQDGKIEMRIANQEIDIRVSSLPLNEGESMVMRFLKKESVRYDMSILGVSQDIQSLIEEDLKTTAGVVLLTGPTGSGKTTSLYTFLNALNNDDVKIITLEDPVEYQLKGINQVQVNPDIGFTFANGLRSIVRQDPDVIMLGEIRDQETAQIALQSALTGHLVFSTVHTNNAAGAYTRLLDLGVEEFLLNAALVSIVAQRLARKVCPHCCEELESKDTVITKYQLNDLASRFNLKEINLVKPNGCEQCGHTGYKGRVAIMEYLRCDEQINALPKDEDFIANAKRHNRMLNRRDLIEDGLLKAIQGTTTIDEVLRVAG